jgi:CheY-like chemotaxis protein
MSRKTEKNRKPGILLIEDDSSHAELLKRILEQCRVQVDFFHITNGESALDYLFPSKNHSNENCDAVPDLIILDLRLSKVDGLEILSRIKSDTDLRCVPVVILTTSVSDGDITEAYRQYANSYVVKPMDYNKLVDLIDDLTYYWLVWNRLP